MKHKQLKWMLCMMALLLGSVSFAQLRIKPGGVTGAKLWLRTDIDSLLTLSGANVTTWRDASGYKDSSTFKKNDALASTSTYAQYTVPEDTLQNGIPYLDFRTTRTINYSTQLDFNYKSMFWVGSYRLPMNGDVGRSFSWLDKDENPTGSSTERSFYLNSTPNYNINGGMTIPAGPPARNAPYFRWMGNPGNYYRSVRVRSRMGMTASQNFFYNTDDSNIYTTVNGTVIWWTKEHPTQHIWAPINGRIILGGYVGSGGKTTITTDYRGTMSEFIGFDRELTFEEVQRVESYIAMKYGVSYVGYTKTFGSNHPFQDNINVTGRDYKLSDGTIIWNGLKDRTLDPYHAYMHFLVRDDSSALYNKKSTPTQSFNQRWSNYNTSIMYLDNNVTVAVGDNVNVPGEISTDKSYVVMGGFTKYQTMPVSGASRDTVCTGTPYTYSTLVVNGKTYQVWDRTYRVKSKGIPVISMKIVPTKEAWNTVAPGTNNKKWGLNRNDWLAFYPTQTNPNAGVLVVNADGTSNFVKGQLTSGTLRVNGIHVPEDGMLYVCFDKTDNVVKINEGNQVLCKTGSAPFQFTATPAGGTWSSNAPGGLFVPANQTEGTSYAVTYTVNKMVASVNVDVVSATPTATLASTTSSKVNNGEAYTLEVTATTKAGKNPLYTFAIGSGAYSTPTTAPNFVVKGSDLTVGANTINVKVLPQVTSGSCTPTVATASKVVTKVDAAARALPGGVDAPALWVRADQLEQTQNVYDVDSNLIAVKVLKFKDLSPNALTVAATVNGDTIAPELVNDWGANGTPAVFFKSKSVFKTTVNKDYKAFFIVNTFAAADTSLPYNTPLSIRPLTDPTTDNTRFFALHPYSFLAWNGGMSTSLQKLYVYSSGWGYENTVPNKSFWVDQATAQTFYEKRGTGLPMMNHFVMRDANNKFVWGSNGAGVFEYKRSGNTTVPGNPTTAQVAVYSWNGKLALGGAYLKAGKGKYTELFYGKMAEVVAFDRILTPKEVNKVESYLGMRYGFSLRGYNADNAEATLSDFRDYELSDGTLVYPAASDTSLQRFYADVNFLVRDDASQLNVVKNKPISHGAQYLIPDLVSAAGTPSTFSKVTNDQQQGGFIRKVGNVTAVVGSDIDNPAAIAVDKGYFAMGKKQACEDVVISKTLGGVLFDKVWDASFKMKSANISKVSLKFEPLTTWGEGFGHGCGIVAVTPNSTTFFDGEVVNGNMVVDDFTPIDGAEIYVVLSNNILPVDVPRAVCQTQTITLSDYGDGVFVGPGVSNGQFIAANASLGSNNVLYSQAGLTYDMVMKVYDPALFTTNLVMDVDNIQVGQPERSYVTMQGVPPGLTFLLPEGSALPDGLSLAADGLVSGIPTVEGTFNFSVRAQAGECVKVDDFSVNVTCPTMDITSTELSSGVFNQPYSDRIIQSISNGSTIYTITAPDSTIPRGLTLAANGKLTATQAKAVGTFVINASLNLGNCPVVTKPVSVTLYCPTIAISANALQGARVGRAFAKSLAAMNGQDPYKFELIPGSVLPEGLSMDTTGLIMGTPATSTGNMLHNFDVKVTDKNSCEATKSTFIYVEIATAAGDLKLATFNAYPNPVLDGKLKVQLVNDQTKPVQLQLVDIKGNVLYSTEVPNGSQLTDEIISMAGYAPGMYFLRAICENKSSSMQIVVR